MRIRFATALLGWAISATTLTAEAGASKKTVHRKPNRVAPAECGVSPTANSAVDEMQKNAWGKPEYAALVNQYVKDCFEAYANDGTSADQQADLKAKFDVLSKMCDEWRKTEGFHSDCLYHAMRFVDQLKGH